MEIFGWALFGIVNVRPLSYSAAFLLFAEFCVTVYSDHIPSIAESRACSCRMATARCSYRLRGELSGTLEDI